MTPGLTVVFVVAVVGVALVARYGQVVYARRTARLGLREAHRQAPSADQPTLVTNEVTNVERWSPPPPRRVVTDWRSDPEWAPEQLAYSPDELAEHARFYARQSETS